MKNEPNGTKRVYRKYRRELKLEAVKMVLEQKMKSTEVARSLGHQHDNTFPMAL